MPTKAKMVQAWNELRPAGHPALGGHSPRRSGAKRRAREGWDIQVILVLGRWASSAILGYIEEAMAELIPGAKKRFADHMDDWEHALPALSKRVGELEKQVASLRKSASVEKAARVQLEVKVASQEPEPCEVVVENRRFLRSTRPNGKIHREATRWASQPSYRSTTGCGWKFGLSVEYEFMEHEEVEEVKRSTLAGVMVASRFCTKGCDCELITLEGEVLLSAVIICLKRV